MATVLDFRDSGRILSVTHTTTAEKVSAILRASQHLATQAILYVFSTVAGTLDVDYIDLRGNAREMSTDLAIAANTLTIVTFEFFVPGLTANFTPSAATGTTDIDGFML